MSKKIVFKFSKINDVILMIFYLSSLILFSFFIDYPENASRVRVIMSTLFFIQMALVFHSIQKPNYFYSIIHFFLFLFLYVFIWALDQIPSERKVWPIFLHMSLFFSLANLLFSFLLYKCETGFKETTIKNFDKYTYLEQTFLVMRLSTLLPYTTSFILSSISYLVGIQNVYWNTISALIPFISIVAILFFVEYKEFVGSYGSLIIFLIPTIVWSMSANPELVPYLLDIFFYILIVSATLFWIFYLIYNSRYRSLVSDRVYVLFFQFNLIIVLINSTIYSSESILNLSFNSSLNYNGVINPIFIALIHVVAVLFITLIGSGVKRYKLSSNKKEVNS
jgi:hypothetical protein